MINITTLTRNYLNEQHMMQLATIHTGRPLVCTVYFVPDADFNLYWVSLPSRRHSEDILTNSNVAAAIAVKFTKGEKVAGLQFEGTAARITPTLEIAQKYADRFARSSEWIDDFIANKTANQLYRLSPSHIYLFDDINFPGGVRQKVL